MKEDYRTMFGIKSDDVDIPAYEWETDSQHMKRIGFIEIDRKDIEINPAFVLKCMSQIIVLEAFVEEIEDRIAYLAMSPMFDILTDEQLTEGDIPGYEFLKSKGKEATIKKVNTDV